MKATITGEADERGVRGLPDPFPGRTFRTRVLGLACLLVVGAVLANAAVSYRPVRGC